MSVSRVMVPLAPAAPAGSTAFGTLAAVVLAAVAVGIGAVRAVAARRRAARRERRLALERQALVDLARAHAATQPSFAADLYHAATRHGAD